MDTILIALGDLFEFQRISMLVTGVLLGLIIGVIPGLGGVFGLTILVPVTYSLDPVAAFALLMGMSSVTTTSDTIPAVLMGVPGTVGSAATAIDGHELAKQGHAARAIGAAYSASLIGGLFGALLLAVSLPVLKPLVLLLNYGDLLAITIFGLTLVSLLSGKNQMRGLFAALLGVLVSFIGLDPYEGEERWTFGQIYLWDGIPTGIFFLGLFAISELASLLQRGAIQERGATQLSGGLMRGMRETLSHWTLVLRCSALGSLLGAVPGVGVTVIEWIAYGLVGRRPGDGPPLGEGNIRAVIAPESANNAKEGGALMPTIAFGIPGSATMAILLGAFAVHGIVPGPRLLDSNPELIVVMILSVALANILATSICLGLTPQLARIAAVPASYIVPLALVFVVLGAFHNSKDVRDILLLLTLGLAGILMKRLGWSRPAFALGFVLGPNLERFFFLSYQIDGWAWLTQPLVIVILALAIAGVLRETVAWRRGRLSRVKEPVPGANLIFTAALGAVVLLCLISALRMPFGTGTFPTMAAGAAVLLAVPLLITALSRLRGAEGWAGTARPILADTRILLYAAGLGALILLLGHLWGAFAFLLITGVAIFKGRPLRWTIIAGTTALFIFLIFDLLISQPWPEPILSRLLP